MSGPHSQALANSMRIKLWDDVSVMGICFSLSAKVFHSPKENTNKTFSYSFRHKKIFSEFFSELRGHEHSALCIDVVLVFANKHFLFPTILLFN